VASTAAEIGLIPAAVRRAWTAREATETADRMCAGHWSGARSAFRDPGRLSSSTPAERARADTRRGDLAGDPEHRQEVGPVRRDLDVEDGVVESEHRDHVPTRLELRRQDQDALVGGRDPQLVGRAEHPVGRHPADLASAERLGQPKDPRAGRGERNEVAGAHVPDADDDLLLAGAGLHARDAQLFAVGVVADLEHPGNDHA
jgi:hypothetical protein